MQTVSKGSIIPFAANVQTGRAEVPAVFAFDLDPPKDYGTSPG